MDLRTSHPDQPWLWRADWAAGEIHSSPRAKAIALTILAVLWNVFTWSIAANVLAAPDRSSSAAWIMLLPALGLVFLLWAMRAWLQLRVYGESRFVLKAVPGSIGGTLEGAVRALRPLPPMRSVKLKLTCIRTTRGGDGKSTAMPVWSDQCEATTDDTGAIPVAFAIPPGCLPSANDSHGDSTTWKLIASATANPVSYRAAFEVPIFETSATSAQPADADELRAQRDARVNAFEAPEHSRIRVTLTADGTTEVLFPAFRNPGVALGVLAIFALWIGITVVLFSDHAPLIFRIVWPLFDVLLTYWTLSLLFGSTKVLARSGEILIVRRLVGIPLSRRRLSASEISDVRPASGMSSGSTAYRRLQVQRMGQQPVYFGDGIPDSIEAESLASRISQAVGLPDHRERHP